MLILFTTIYRIRNHARLAEIRTCIGKNAANPGVERVFVFSENVDRVEYTFLDHPKIELIPVPRRPAYKDFFDYARKHCAGRTVAICNSDVYFDDTISVTSKVNSDELWCITRHNVLPGGGLELQGNGVTGSSDAWIFVAPIKEFQSDILLGVNGCDSYLAQKADKAGIKLANPCRQIVIRHLHDNDERNNSPNNRNYWQEPDYAYFCVRPS